MPDNNSQSAAEVADRHRRYMALAMLALAVMYVTKAGVHLVSENMGEYLELFQVGMALITVAFIAPLVIWKIRHRAPSERLEYFDKDGYAAQALIFAQKRSWAITFVLLCFLEPLEQILGKYPVDFVLQLILALMLGTMSMLFLYKTRSTDGLAFEGGAHA